MCCHFKQMVPLAPRSNPHSKPYSHPHPHTHAHKHTLGVGKSAAWGTIHGVRLSSDHSILQIPACNYTGRSDSALYLLSTNREEGGDHPQILLCSPHAHTHTRTHSQPTTEDNQLVRRDQWPLNLLHCGLLKPKHFEHKYPLLCV